MKCGVLVFFFFKYSVVVTLHVLEAGFRGFESPTSKRSTPGRRGECGKSDEVSKSGGPRRSGGF